MALTPDQVRFKQLLQQKEGAINASKTKLAQQIKDLRVLADDLRAAHFPGDLDAETAALFDRLCSVAVDTAAEAEEPAAPAEDPAPAVSEEPSEPTEPAEDPETDGGE